MVGRKIKLSTYRSKKDIYRKKHQVFSQRSTGFNQNFIQLENCSNEENVDSLKSDSDIEEADYELSSDSDGFEHLLPNEENSSWDFVEKPVELAVKLSQLAQFDKIGDACQCMEVVNLWGTAITQITVVYLVKCQIYIPRARVQTPTLV